MGLLGLIVYGEVVHLPAGSPFAMTGGVAEFVINPANPDRG